MYEFFSGGHPQRLTLTIFIPLAPVPVVTGEMNIDLHFTSDVITLNQIRHHLYSSTAGGKCLSMAMQIRSRVIGSKGLEICLKMLRNLSEK